MFLLVKNATRNKLNHGYARCPDLSYQPFFHLPLPKKLF